MDTYGDHLQTCQTQSTTLQIHDWVVYKLGTLLGSVGHKVKIHKITPATGKEQGDMEIKDRLSVYLSQASFHSPLHYSLLVYSAKSC